MAPLLRTGDVVAVQCLPPDALQPGDLICFQRDGGFVLHRLLKCRVATKPCFFEKGDAESGGSWLEEACVVGRAIRINGQELDEAVSARMLAVSRWESALVSGLRRLGLPPLPRALHAWWRVLRRLVAMALLLRNRIGERTRPRVPGRCALAPPLTPAGGRGRPPLHARARVLPGKDGQA